MSNTVAIDFETFYSTKAKYTLRRQMAREYCRHELFDPYLMSIFDGKESWVGDPRRFNWATLDGKHLLAHNRGFDEEVLIEMQRRKWIPTVGYSRFTCTAQMASYVFGVDSLADSAMAAWGTKLDKSVRESADGRQFSSYSKEDREAMIKYADADAINCWKLFDEFGSKWPDWEQKLADLSIRQGRHGIHIDREELDRQEALTYDAIKATEKKLPWRAADWYDDDFDDDEDMFGPSSLKAIAEECARNSIPAPPGKTKYPELFEEWNTKYQDKCQWVGPLSAWRTLNKHRRLLQRVRSRTDEDDIMFFLLRYYRAHTGRWAGAGQMNMQNQRRDAILLDKELVAIVDKAKIAAAVGHSFTHGKWPDWIGGTLDFRRLLTARPGKKMISSDLAQIEPRVLAWLVGDHEMLRYVNEGVSVYEAHARKSMGWTGGNLKKENLQVYQLAKARVLSLGYGAGWKKFITMALNYTGEDITADDPEFEVVVDPVTLEEYEQPGYGQRSREIVNDFRNSNPKIIGMWKNFDEQLRASVGGDLTVTLPSGRKMKYKKVAMSAVVRPDKDGKPQKRMVITAEVMGQRREFYGGKIVENCLAGGTELLTQSGWKKIVDVETSDMLWDGLRWVAHGGVVSKGRRETQSCFGVDATPEHMLLTPRGWRTVEEINHEKSQTSKADGENFWQPHSNVLLACREWQDILEMPLSVRPALHQDEQRSESKSRWSDPLLAHMLRSSDAHARVTYDTRHEQSPSVRSVAFTAGAMCQYGASCVQELRRTWHHCVSSMEFVRELLARYAMRLSTWVGNRSQGQQRGLLQRELSVGLASCQLFEPPQHGDYCGVAGPSPTARLVSINPILPYEARSVSASLARCTRRVSEVYDVVDSGPDHRFVIRGGPSMPMMISHNCTQAVARDVFGVGMCALDDAGFWNLFSAHDESVLEVDPDVKASDVAEVMGVTPEWLPGCPIDAEAAELDHYKK